MHTIFILHAHNTVTNHIFIELFTTIELLSAYLTNHPEISKDEITLHELNPT